MLQPRLKYYCYYHTGEFKGFKQIKNFNLSLVEYGDSVPLEISRIFFIKPK
jgi:hypothetical protein